MVTVAAKLGECVHSSAHMNACHYVVLMPMILYDGLNDSGYMHLSAHMDACASCCDCALSCGRNVCAKPARV